MFVLSPKGKFTKLHVDLSLSLSFRLIIIIKCLILFFYWLDCYCILLLYVCACGISVIDLASKNVMDWVSIFVKKRPLFFVFLSSRLLYFHSKILPLPTHSEGTGASFPTKSHYPVAEYRSHRTNHTHSAETKDCDVENGYAVALSAGDSGSESEVEIFAVDDRRTETVPLATSPQ